MKSKRELKTVLITGASSGIGEACARVFASHGCNLVLLARRLPKLKALKSVLEEKYSIKAHVFSVDISKQDQIQKFARAKKLILKEVGVLINNAGLASGLSFFQDSTPDDWHKMIDTNLKGVLYLTHEILPFFITKKAGHIINVGSVAGHCTYPKGNIYSATKHALKAFNESLRLDLCGHGIRVSMISPGMVETEFSLVRLKEINKAKAVYQGMTPLTAKDIAENVFWISNQPNHVNIQDLIIYPTDQASPTVCYRR